MPIAVLAALATSLSGCAAEPAGPPVVSSASAAADFFVTRIAERNVDTLPDGPLYWTVEVLPEAGMAEAPQGPYALDAVVDGRHWRFTLGGTETASPGATRMVQIGPVAVPAATHYLLRVNRAGGPPGARTPVHSHPGSEAIYVLRGEVTQRTAHGTERAPAGQILNAHAPEMVMQLASTGAADLDQLVMFVVDAGRPFSPAAQFPDE